jgi:hypothetical protein
MSLQAKAEVTVVNSGGGVKREIAKCGLHPLIHTIPSGNSAQNLVAWSQDEKCGLKYVVHSLE